MIVAGGDDIELAYRPARRSWGQGIATEAAGALVDYKGTRAAYYVVTPEARGAAART